MATKYLDYTGLSYFYSKLKTINESAITTAINEALSELNQSLVTIVSALPTTGEEGKLYMIPDTNDTNKYTTYAWEEGAFKPIGSTTLDFDSNNYYTKTEADSTFVKKTELTNYYNKEEVDKLISNISIEGGVSVKAIPLSTIEEICV